MRKIPYDYKKKTPNFNPGFRSCRDMTSVVTAISGDG